MPSVGKDTEQSETCTLLVGVYIGTTTLETGSIYNITIEDINTLCPPNFISKCICDRNVYICLLKDIY